MAHFDGILFDLDGTLLDTARDLGNALNYVLKHHGRAPSRYEDYRCIASDGAKGLLQLGFGKDFDHLDFAAARKMLLDHYLAHIYEDTVPFDGVNMLLERLNQADIPWGIVTNKPEDLTLALLSNFPVMGQCKSIIAGDTLAKRKPDPLPLLHAANMLNIDPKRSLYVGDAPRDIEAAQRANMPSIAALYGYIEHPDVGLGWNADYAVNCASDIWDILTK